MRMGEQLSPHINAIIDLFHVQSQELEEWKEKHALLFVHYQTLQEELERLKYQLNYDSYPSAPIFLGDKENILTTTTTTDNNNNTKLRPVYKYMEPIRKHKEREQLMAMDCPQCRHFYTITGVKPPPFSSSTLCDHPIEGEKEISSPSTHVFQHVQQVSRHRHLYLPPNTPPGYWDVDFPE